MKTEIQTETDASASSATSALNLDLESIRNTRGLSKLIGFSDRQLEHINAWLDEQVAYRKIAGLCLSEWQREVPHMTIARYAKRRMALTLSADLTDSKEAAAEISRYAATGDASFSTNTLELLEQQAFDLAAVYQRDNDAADLDTLKKLTAIINQSRNTRVRERHATVQEQKLQLRREELALKRELLASKNGGGTRSPSPTSLSRDAIINHDAAQADQSASASLSQQGRGLGEGLSTTSTSDAIARENQKSEIEASSFLSPEALEETNRHAILLLANKIKTHYQRDPENSPLAKFYALTAPEIIVQAQQIAALSETEWAAHPWNPENSPNTATHHIDREPANELNKLNNHF